MKKKLTKENVLMTFKDIKNCTKLGAMITVSLKDELNESSLILVCVVLDSFERELKKILEDEYE